MNIIQFKRIPLLLEQETKLEGHYCAVTNLWEFMAKVEGNPLGDSIVGFFATAIVNQHRPAHQLAILSLQWAAFCSSPVGSFRADPLT